jgi:pyruvate,water dikinase
MYPEYFQFDRTPERTEYEHGMFWFWDKKDTTEPILPWDATISAQAWQIAMAQNTSRVFPIPPAMTVDIRIIAGYAFFSAIPCEDEELLAERAEVFTERSNYYYENFDGLYRGTWKPRVEKIGNEIDALEVPAELPRYVPEDVIIEGKGESQNTLTLLQNYNRLTELALEGWQRHFEFLYLAYLAYLSFQETCQELFPNISDDAIGKMVSGVQADLFRPDQELNELAELAVELGNPVIDVLTSDASPEEKIAQLETTDDGETFMTQFNEVKDPWFYLSYGDGFHSYKGSWIDDLEAPFEHLDAKITRLQDGKSIGRDFEQLQQEREDVVEEYRSYLDSEVERDQFTDAYETCLDIYEYAEDHQFWIEHRLHTLIFQKMQEFGQLVANEGLLDDPEDIFLFTRFEVAELLEEVCETWALGPTGYVPEAWKQKADERHKMIDAAREWEPSPALGHPPEEVTDPLVIMLWGITTEKVYDWLEAEASDEKANTLDGFGSSTGTVEGTARVVMSTEELNDLEDDEIIVCPLTNPAWAPVFPRIKGAVTNDGGITSHAAIVCREYGVPAVTGTGNATSQIETGDQIRVDGEGGTVEILNHENS